MANRKSLSLFFTFLSVFTLLLSQTSNADDSLDGFERLLSEQNYENEMEARSPGQVSAKLTLKSTLREVLDAVKKGDKENSVKPLLVLGPVQPGMFDKANLGVALLNSLNKQLEDKSFPFGKRWTSQWSIALTPRLDPEAVFKNTEEISSAVGGIVRFEERNTLNAPSIVFLSDVLNSQAFSDPQDKEDPRQLKEGLLLVQSTFGTNEINDLISRWDRHHLFGVAEVEEPLASEEETESDPQEEESADAEETEEPVAQIKVADLSEKQLKQLLLEKWNEYLQVLIDSDSSFSKEEKSALADSLESKFNVDNLAIFHHKTPTEILDIAKQAASATVQGIKIDFDASVTEYIKQASLNGTKEAPGPSMQAALTKLQEELIPGLLKFSEKQIRKTEDGREFVKFLDKKMILFDRTVVETMPEQMKSMGFSSMLRQRSQLIIMGLNGQNWKVSAQEKEGKYSLDFSEVTKKEEDESNGTSEPSLKEIENLLRDKLDTLKNQTLDGKPS